MQEGAETRLLKDTIADIIMKLKKVRAENGLTYESISDLVEQNGYHVSMFTIRRVFEEGSEEYGWQYQNTLKPIADAVLGVYAVEPETEGKAEEETVDALRAVVRLKNEMIEELTARIKRTEESYKRRLDFVMDQIALKDGRIDRRDDMIEKLVDVVVNRPNCPHCSKCGTDKKEGEL